MRDRQSSYKEKGEKTKAKMANSKTRADRVKKKMEKVEEIRRNNFLDIEVTRNYYCFYS